VATATFQDLRRRPGVLLATLAIGIFLLLLPDLCTRAVEDSSSLALQAALSTVTLFLVLVAGFAGLRAAAREGDLSAAPEWRAAPVSAAAYVAGRFGGVMAAVLLLFVALVPFGLVAAIGANRDVALETHSFVLALAGLIAIAAEFAAIGLLTASIAPPQLAAVLFIAILIASRVLVPELARLGGVAAAAAAVLPDPARLDLSRELAFARPTSAASLAFALAAAALQTAAFLALAAAALARRED
jgi:hypothetical protein